MTKKCLDCKATVIDDLESEMENEVPMWYKKAGNYSLLPNLLNCEDKYNPNKTELEEKTPDISEVRIEVPVNVEVDKDENGTWIFYWASLSNKELEINGPEAAYGDESNSGLIKSDKKGDAKLILNCPQPYRVDGITYPRHVHYTLLTSDNVWSFDVKTLVIYCDLDREQFEKSLKSKDHIIINALSEEDHNKKSIPDTFNLPVSTLNENNREDKVSEFIEQHIKKYPELEDLVKKEKLDIKDVPIITYCADSECNASKNLAKHIMNAGYSNVVEYNGGIKEWFNEKDSDDDTTDEEEFFEEDTDKYNLDNSIETLIINGIKYKHEMNDMNYIYDEDDNIVNELKDDEIIWNDGEMKKEILIDTTDEEEESDKEESDKEESDKEESDKEESDKEESDKEESDKEDSEDKKNKKGGSSSLEKRDKLSYDGIYLCDGGGDIITQDNYNNLFRGWGFTFL